MNVMEIIALINSAIFLIRKAKENHDFPHDQADKTTAGLEALIDFFEIQSDTKNITVEQK